MAPLILGEWSLVVRLPVFSPVSSRLSWEILSSAFLVVRRVLLHMDYLFYVTTCLFLGNRPLEELPHQSCSTLRGEVDPGIPRVFRGLWVVVFEA